MDEEEDKKEVPVKTEQPEPEYGSWEWTPFIMSKLLPGIESVEDKKGQKYPKCMGLKRLLEKYVGPIVNVQNQVLVTPTRDNHGIYVVQVTVEVLVENKTHPVNGGYKTIQWSDVSQTWANDEGQSAIVTQNPIASCFTKALSRCLRSLLGLSGVYTSEEMTDVGKPLKSHDPDSRPPMENISGDIKQSQIRFITSICDKYEVDILKVIRDILQDDSIESLNEISAQDGKKIQIAVNELQTKARRANGRNRTPNNLRKEINMTQTRRTSGRTQPAKQPAKQENPRVTTTPLEKNKMTWKIELELPAGGRISVNASSIYEGCSQFFSFFYGHRQVTADACTE